MRKKRKKKSQLKRKKPKKHQMMPLKLHPRRMKSQRKKMIKRQ
jgi:hypothetical protein